MRRLDFGLLAAFSAVLAVVLTLPTSASVQLALAIAIGGAALVLTVLSERPVSRPLFIVLAAALVIKYLAWRLGSTLPPADLSADFAAALLVLAAEAYCIGMLFITVFVVIAPLPPAMRRPLPDAAPTVEVFVPSYNEDPELVAHTLAAAKAMTYPEGRLTVTLLDDGATKDKLRSDDPAVAAAAAKRRDALTAICEALGVRYLARPHNEMAKAGNLNYGLAHSTAELVAVFDADHAPTRDFLLETVGHFAEDDRLFLVQTPHVFLNPDPVVRNLGLAGYAPAENEMFYGTVQRGLDRWNASFFCGSAAVLRRAALDEVGGFAGVSITEDCETALELHGRGWNSRYVDKPMIRGLQPETFAQFIGQRSRWCRGMIQLFILKSPWLRPGLTVAQRLSYTASLMFWFFPLARMTFVLAPLLFIFFDMKIYVASADEFFVYAIPYLLAAVALQSFLFGKYRWPWVSELYEYIQSVHLFRAVVGTILNPRAPTFNVTDKGVTVGESRLSGLALPYFVIFAVLAAAAAYTVHRYGTEPEARTLLLVVGGWNLFNLVLAGIALGSVCEIRQRRTKPRLQMIRPATLSIAGERYPVTVVNASQGGVMIRPDHVAVRALGLGTSGEIEVVGASPAAVRVELRNREAGPDGRLGFRFDGGDTRRYGFVTDLMYADAAVDSFLPERARRRRSVVVWSVELVLHAARNILRGLGFLLFRRRRAAPLHNPAPATVTPKERTAGA
jgi:cellulose synthase (UDP-forming)